MQEVTFEVETITPLFLAGADQEAYKNAWKLKAELRPPSFRGNMRYWLRALIGGSKSLEQITQIENSVFGDTTIGSAVRIRGSSASKEPAEFKAPPGIPLGQGKYKATGTGYLLWSMAESGKKDPKKHKLSRWYFPKETGFTLAISAQDQNETQLKQAIASFWLLTHLGGVGSRSRRCAGSLIVEGIQVDAPQDLKAQLQQNREIVVRDTEGNTYRLSFKKPETANALKVQLEAGIRSARLLCDVNWPPTQYNAEFDVLASGVCHIWILQDKNKKPWPSAETAMEDIGNSLQNYRSSIRDPQGRGQIYDLRLREIFGLPLGKNEDRRASPLHLRIAELQGNQYVGVAVLFKAIGKKTSKDRNITISDYKRIEGWITESNFPGVLDFEVKL